MSVAKVKFNPHFRISPSRLRADLQEDFAVVHEVTNTPRPVASSLLDLVRNKRRGRSSGSKTRESPQRHRPRSRSPPCIHPKPKRGFNDVAQRWHWYGRLGCCPELCDVFDETIEFANALLGSEAEMFEC